MSLTIVQYITSVEANIAARYCSNSKYRAVGGCWVFAYMCSLVYSQYSIVLYASDCSYTFMHATISLYMCIYNNNPTSQFSRMGNLESSSVHYYIIHCELKREI